MSRYAEGLRALRPDSEGLVVLDAITSMPAQLVTPQALSAVDFADTDAREAFFAALLADPMMQPRIDPKQMPSPDDDQLRPSCASANGLVYPPVPIVESARALGRDAVVQSICQDDFGPAIDAILAAITRASNSACIVQ